MTPQEKRQIWHDINQAFGDNADLLKRMVEYMIDRKLADKKAKQDAKDAEFEQWYAEYPRREAKIAARKAWNKLDFSVLDIKEMLNVLDHQKRQWKQNKTEKKYIPLPSTYLNKGRHFDRIESGFKRELKQNKLCKYCGKPASMQIGNEWVHPTCEQESKND